MSKPKQCPLTFSSPDMGKGTYDCIQEKCAWWIEEYDYPNGQTNPAKLTGGGHCVALDWGKK